MMPKQSSSTDFWLLLSARLYQSLIFTLPKEFRQNYAAEMTQVFRDCCRRAYSRKGIWGVLGELITGTFDLLINSVKERLMTLFSDEKQLLIFVLTAILAIAGGLLAALADLRNDDVQAPVLLVLIFAFALGFIRPSSFWFSGLLIGLMMPVIHFLAQLKGWDIKYPTDASTPFWAFLALIPAFIGAVSGAVFRLFVNYVWNRFG